MMKIGNDVYVILVCARLRRSHRIGDSLGGVSGHQFERAAASPVGDHLCVCVRAERWPLGCTAHVRVNAWRRQGYVLRARANTWEPNHRTARVAVLPP